MPIDPNIVLQAGRVQAVDPLEAVGKAFSLRQLAQQSRMGALQEAHTRQQLAAADRATQQDAAFRAELGANDNPRGNQKLLAIDPKRALEVWKGLDEQQKAALATEKEVSGRIASSAGAILGVADDQLAAAYEQERAALLQTPAGQMAKIPPASAFPHPAALRSWLTIKQKAAQSAHEQITSAEKAVTAELQRQRDAEAVRHNQATEADATADNARADLTLGETKRHNRATEGQAAATLAETGRHNKASEERLTTGKPATGEERQTLAFFNRAKQGVEEAQTVEDRVAASGVVPQWWMRKAPNPALDAAQRAYQNSQRAFTEARLRKESGAAIQPFEYENDSKTYFVQPGDTKADVERKRRLRETVIEGLGFSAGKAYDEYYGEANPHTAKGRQSTNDSKATPAKPAPQVGGTVSFQGKSYKVVGIKNGQAELELVP